jgi:hypothetical protein
LNTFSIDENLIKESGGGVFLVGSDIPIVRHMLYFFEIRVIKILPNSEQSNKGKVSLLKNIRDTYTTGSSRLHPGFFGVRVVHICVF